MLDLPGRPAGPGASATSSLRLSLVLGRNGDGSRRGPGGSAHKDPDDGRLSWEPPNVVDRCDGEVPVSPA